ncbi:hypothetical protein D9C73_003689 [Collichthys lucidus]|uniref:Uncharacterized protein n=1 Tax=Collichthys lucidus TaxID=240159 RepID=A0A4U5U5V1_COLLU|nr:hypothetical protein D9C73_003689 [Collichthys lucidus]
MATAERIILYRSSGCLNAEWRLQSHPTKICPLPKTGESVLVNGVLCRTTWHYVVRRVFDIGATGQNNTPQCEYFSLLMMNRSGLEQSVVRTGLWPVS